LVIFSIVFYYLLANKLNERKEYKKLIAMVSWYARLNAHIEPEA